VDTLPPNNATERLGLLQVSGRRNAHLSPISCEKSEMGLIPATADLDHLWFDTESRVRDSEQRFRLMVESVRDYAIFMLDVEGRVETWNAGAEAIKGYRAGEIIGQHLSRFYTPEDMAAGLPQRLLEAAARDGRVENEGWRVRRDGSRFWADVVITALRDSGGRLQGFAKVTRDLTERKRAEEDRLSLVQAQEAIRLRDEFLSIASHELRTPLTSLQLQLQSIRQRLGATEVPLAQRLERATRSTERLAGLIDALLDVSRISSGTLSLNLQVIDLSEVARDVTEGLLQEASTAGCSLRLDAPVPVPGTWDQLRIEQVLINLLSNAFRHAPGQPVDVRIRQEGGEARLTVEDRGPGIRPEDLERIFGRFERAAPARNYGGLGLGLYVSREIAQAHGGSIEAKNREGGGASFLLRLPLDPEAPGSTEA
jgi:PAS domain S-box-containing protein